ncbi:hypothetical protein MRX96_017756 [Rhipicephalus microplus]
MAKRSGHCFRATRYITQPSRRLFAFQSTRRPGCSDAENEVEEREAVLNARPMRWRFSVPMGYSAVRPQVTWKWAAPLLGGPADVCRSFVCSSEFVRDSPGKERLAVWCKVGVGAP